VVGGTEGAPDGTIDDGGDVGIVLGFAVDGKTVIGCWDEIVGILVVYAGVAVGVV
jgi:hypothetical protein